MHQDDLKTYWRSTNERDGAAKEADPGAASPNAIGPAGFSRRQFLEAAGFTASLAILGGCGRAPEESALPFAVQPAGVIPGRLRSYAATCGGCPAACGALVSVRDGRPLKMEGMPQHPLSRGGLCAIGQALPLGLYDSTRLRGPLRDGKQANWDDVDRAIIERLGEIAVSGGKVRFVTSSSTSPTLQSAIDAFLAAYDDARHVTFDAISSSAILDAHAQTHGVRVLPHVKFDAARVIVSFGADFLGTWISPVEFSSAWATRRSPTLADSTMSYHVQLEGRTSLTGSNADRRIRLAPDEYAAVLSSLAVNVCQLAGVSPPDGSLGEPPIAEEELTDLAERLWGARGECLVVSDSQEVAVQKLVNFINHTLNAYGATLDIQRPSHQRRGNDADVIRLIDELLSGEVSALIVGGTDLVHNLPDYQELAQAIERVPLVISFAERVDDFASLADFVCPDHHPLESWLDAQPVEGSFSLSQPTLAPLGDTRSILESVARWSGRGETALEMLQAYWRENLFPRAAAALFQPFWDQAVHDGFVDLPAEPADSLAFNDQSVQLAGASSPSQAAEGEDLSVTLYSKVGLTDGRHAHNPWLQELPDPVTKVTWDNYVCIAPALAERMAITEGDIVRVEATEGVQLELPAFVQPGQHDRVVSIALAYGVRGTDRFASIGPDWIEARPTVAPGELVGKNAAGLIEVRDGMFQYTRGGVTLSKTGGRRALATTQLHHRLEVPPNVAPYGAEMREPVQETSLKEFQTNPTAGAPGHDLELDHQLWPEDHPKRGHAWGMVIDLNRCTGCSACLIACQSENNVPVVGKDEVRRQREMHWIRIDRYYSGDDDDLTVAHQPMMCQHCDNAPCETVCPVLATVHGEEGLNEQAYNRCVGTRYCANNCPYKVRRFNWFKYDHSDTLKNLVLNPNVTVRSRGVMEKCSMCVQRIEEGKIEAKRLGQPVVDGSILTACQQSCPARAIEFGDMNDVDSRVHAALQNPRRYGVLEEFNFRPSVSYLRTVHNRDAEGGGDV